MTCGKCIDGWIYVSTPSGADAVKPCPTCRPPRAPDSGTPITEEDATASAQMLTAMLSFAPENDLAHIAIARFLIDDLCQFKEEAEWIARRVPQLHSKWDTCGLAGLRQIFCSRYQRPKDGLITTSTPTYPDGVPPERPQAEFPPAPIALQPAQATADQTLNGHITAGAARLPLENARRQLSPAEIRREQEFNGILEAAITHQPERQPEPPPIAPSPRRLSEIVRLHDDEPHNEPLPAGSYQPITAADIERELEKRKPAAGERNGNQ